MNEMANANYQAPLVAGGPQWLTLSFVLIGLGVLFALVILAWGTRLASRRSQVRKELEERGELIDEAPGYTLSPPPVAPAPPPIAPAPPPIADASMPASAPESALSDEPVTEEPLADEPIAAAAPLDAAPASLAASDPAPASAPPASAHDDLTRMKGVGPRLADRLNMVGVTSFAQIAALSPAEADALDARMGDFQGRIHRDRWVEQAGYLAAGDVAGYEAVFGKL